MVETPHRGVDVLDCTSGGGVPFSLFHELNTELRKSCTGMSRWRRSNNLWNLSCASGR